MSKNANPVTPVLRISTTGNPKTVEAVDAAGILPSFPL